MHYAIVKCERVQEEWVYGNEWNSNYSWKIDIDLNLRRYLAANDSDYQAIWLNRVKNDFIHWDEYLKTFSPMNLSHIKNGQCILWEGDINQERLRITDKLYIPTLEQYLEINNVETTPDGKITYYVDYTQVFYDTSEQSRLKSIEEWIADEYSEIESFKELNQYKDTPNKYRKVYDELLEYKESLSNPTKRAILNEDNSYAIEFKKEIVIDTNDLKWQNIVLISVLGFLGLIAFMVLVSIMN